MSLFLTNLGPAPTDFKEKPTPSQAISEDPYIFSKLSSGEGHGWAPNYSMAPVDDSRWGIPYIYPGVGSIDWKWLKGSQYVFVFTDSNLTDGWWQPRAFFDDVMNRGWVSSSKFKYYADLPAKNVSLPPDPWILKFYKFAKYIDPLSVGLLEDLSKWGRDVKDDLPDAEDWKKYILAGVGVITLWLYLSRR